MDPEKKSLNFIFPTKYVIPKSLKFSHWPSKICLSYERRIDVLFFLQALSLVIVFASRADQGPSALTWFGVSHPNVNLINIMSNYSTRFRGGPSGFPHIVSDT